jgi:S1-C subfamily serine protease
MRTKHLFATLVVAVVAAASLGVAVALNAPEVGRRTIAGTGGDAGPGTGARAGGDPAGRNGGRPAGTAGGRTPAEGTGHHDQQQRLSQADLVAKIKPSVVHLAGSSGSGSGVVVDGDRGLVLTNAHVTAGQQGMRARVGDDPASETAVRLVAAAPCDDLAVVELVSRPPNLRAIRLGDSSRVRPGDHVTVLGYPASFEEQTESILDQQVVTNDGSVSAVNVVAAPDPGLPRYLSTIQHQAPVNHGNSGGPLVDDEGRLVGVNSLGNDDAQGQFYSISVNRVRQLLPDLLAGRSQANLGWELYPRSEVDLGEIFANDPDFAGQGGAAFGQQVAEQLDQDGVDGLYVWDTEPGSSAEAGNLDDGDLVTRIDGQPVSTVQDVCDLVLAKRPGATVRVDGLYLDSTADPAQVGTSWETEVQVG